jgi:DNA-directed RNA polymerase subunit K/omega
MCAPVMVELEGETDPLEIAIKELKQGRGKLRLSKRVHSYTQKKAEAKLGCFF